MNILIDSWAWIEIFENTEKTAKVLSLIKNPENLVRTTSLNAYEVWYEIVKRAGRQEAASWIATMNQHAHILPIDQSLAIKAGDIRLQEGLSAVDSFVYAAALATNSYVVTGDRKHFGGKKNVILF